MDSSRNARTQAADEPEAARLAAHSYPSLDASCAHAQAHAQAAANPGLPILLLLFSRLPQIYQNLRQVE